MVDYPKQFENILHFRQHNNFLRVLGRCYFTGLNVYITSLYIDLNVAPNFTWNPNNFFYYTDAIIITNKKNLRLQAFEYRYSVYPVK